jgi:hypothetical protein
MPPIRYAVTIDTEEQWDWSAGWPVRSYSLDNIQVVPEFEQLCRQHGARTTWFADGTVMSDSRSRRIMTDLSTLPGVELGMHIHPWLTPPLVPGRETESRWSFLHNYSADLVHAKLASVYGLFQNEGLSPKSFRGGRYSSGGAIHDFLMANGFTVDSSVVPFSRWPDDEGAPDFRDRDLTPRRVGENVEHQGFWEVPLTLAFTRRNFRSWATRFDKIESSVLRHLRVIGILERSHLVRRVWLNFETTPADDMLALLPVLAAVQVPFILLTVHSSSLVVGGNPYSTSSSQVKRIWTTAERLLGELQSLSDFQPATVAEIGDALEAGLTTPR